MKPIKPPIEKIKSLEYVHYKSRTGKVYVKPFNFFKLDDSFSEDEIKTIQGMKLGTTIRVADDYITRIK